MRRANTGLKEYRTWSFWDRSFLLGLVLSVLWHFFWFFSLKIVVSTPRKMEKPRPYLVSLGPVMDDAIFKTIVDTRPEISQSFYRRPSDFTAAADLPVEAAPRHSAGDVVSVPFSRKFMESLKQIVGGVKSSPDFEWGDGAPLSPWGESEEDKKKRLLAEKAAGS